MSLSLLESRAGSIYSGLTLVREHRILATITDFDRNEDALHHALQPTFEGPGTKSLCLNGASGFEFSDYGGFQTCCANRPAAASAQTRQSRLENARYGWPAEAKKPGRCSTLGVLTETMFAGLPNFRFRLPSRNWMIFWTITGSFAAAMMYDRREKRRSQQKWCDLVAHISRETIPIEETRRKLTIYLAAPPGDGLRIARDHFKEYVKPILVAAALDYQVIEGRREGDIRAGTAENIRKMRRKAGEPSSVEEELGVEHIIAEARQKIGVYEEPGPKGDIVIGRHTWKEYVRGLHEGWLGPLDPPPPPPPAPVEETPATPATPEETTGSLEKKEEDTSNITPEDKEKQENTEEKKDEKPKPTGPAPAYLAPTDYSSRALPSTFPQSLEGSVPVPFPHILGFLNTPIRLYRYMNRRHLADNVGREVAGAVLASYSRPYQDGYLPAESSDSPIAPSAEGDIATGLSSRTYEQQGILAKEEQEWHKSIHKRDPVSADGDNEREWLDDIVLDPRIASRMHRYTLSSDEVSRAQRIATGEEYIRGEEKPAPMPLWRHLWVKYGYGEDDETLKRKVVLGDIDGEDGK